MDNLCCVMRHSRILAKRGEAKSAKSREGGESHIWGFAWKKYSPQVKSRPFIKVVFTCSILFAWHCICGPLLADGMHSKTLQGIWKAKHIISEKQKFEDSWGSQPAACPLLPSLPKPVRLRYHFCPTTAHSFGSMVGRGDTFWALSRSSIPLVSDWWGRRSGGKLAVSTLYQILKKKDSLRV